MAFCSDLCQNAVDSSAYFLPSADGCCLSNTSEGARGIILYRFGIDGFFVNILFLLLSALVRGAAPCRIGLVLLNQILLLVALMLILLEFALPNLARFSQKLTFVFGDIGAIFSIPDGYGGYALLKWY